MTDHCNDRWATREKIILTLILTSISGFRGTWMTHVTVESCFVVRTFSVPDFF